MVMEFSEIKSLVKKNNSKIILLVLDGLGGLPTDSNGNTELETADTPNLNKLANDGICGLHQPIAPGITPGSGPAHLALFGYDPLKYKVGRGILSALGINFDLKKGDVAARCNFCTIDDDGVITDRRAGRISTEKNKELLKIIREIKIDGIEILLEPVKEYRFVLILRGEDLSEDVADTDPQVTGKKPSEPKPTSPEAEKTVKLIREFIHKSKDKLKDQKPANMFITRGYSKLPDWDLFPDIYGLKSAAIAAYPMYKGVARLVGMDALNTEDSLESEFETLKNNWNSYDFFYLHVKKIDSYGEDGDFDKKVELIEKVDREIPKLLELNPDVIAVTGDHSTPALMKYHGWQPVPILIHSKFCRADRTEKFSEKECTSGALGPNFPAKDLMLLLMANARRFEKFGA
jgi:2,3-bisphosphoglycerate-independent phosphoglycerate mutase